MVLITDFDDDDEDDEDDAESITQDESDDPALPSVDEDIARGAERDRRA